VTQKKESLHTALDPQQQRSKEEYSARINRVIDFIENNLDQNLLLEDLAKVANFSPFHFHRIFKAMVGETLKQFILRIRCERAAAHLVSDLKKPITAIAYDFGFSGSAAFARAFKEVFNISASEYRQQNHSHLSNIRKTNSNIDQTMSKKRKDFPISSFYINSSTQNQIWRISMPNKAQIKIEVKELPSQQVVYVRHIGPYAGDTELFGRLYGKLMNWAGPRDLLCFPDTQILTVYHDDPNVTDESKLRTSACITITEDTEVGGEIGKMTLPGGKYAVAYFEINTDEFEQAWNTVCGEWLPQSGYQPDDRPCFEHCINDFREHPEKKHIVEICVPVKPL